eukprot:s9917_g1.t1
MRGWVVSMVLYGLLQLAVGDPQSDREEASAAGRRQRSGAEIQVRASCSGRDEEKLGSSFRSAIPSSLRGAAGRIRPIFQGAFALIQRLLWADPDERLTPKQAKYFQVNFLYDDALYDALSESERAIVPAEVAEHCQVRRYLERFWGNVIRRHQRTAHWLGR